LFHLSNHLLGWWDPTSRVRDESWATGLSITLVEPVLVGLMLFQVISGARLAWRWSGAPVDAYRVFQIGSGIYWRRSSSPT